MRPDRTRCKFMRDVRLTQLGRLCAQMESTSYPLAPIGCSRNNCTYTKINKQGASLAKQLNIQKVHNKRSDNEQLE